jgi:hypothetical protein
MEERGNAKMTTLSSEVLLQSLVPYPREPTLPTLSSSSRAAAAAQVVVRAHLSWSWPRALRSEDGIGPTAVPTTEVSQEVESGPMTAA